MMAYSRFIYSALLVSDVDSKTRLAVSLDPVWRPDSSSLLFFQTLFLPSDTLAIAGPRRRVTPRVRRKMMDGRAAPVGFTALFTGRVSRFPGRSDTVQVLDGVVGSGSCIYQAD